jgi:integral membrane protein
MLATPVGRLRLFSVLEAISFLFLLSVAVPMQIAGDDKLVMPAGMTHGILFILYVLAALDLRTRLGWPNQVTGKVLVAAVIPFAPFFVERWLRNLEAPAPAG